MDGSGVASRSMQVSVVVPVYNGEKYLAEAIKSALCQTLRPDEIIVVDDGSTDASASIAEQFGAPVQVLSQEHRGSGSARNRGASVAGGDWLAFLDADDIWQTDKLALQSAALQLDPSAEMAFGMVEQFVSPDVQVNVQIPNNPIKGIYASALLIRRADFYRVGEFTSTWSVGEFIDWYARAVELGLRAVVTPQVVVRRRIHRANQTMLAPGWKADYAHVLKAALDRRRKLDGGG